MSLNADNDSFRDLRDENIGIVAERIHLRTQEIRRTIDNFEHMKKV